MGAIVFALGGCRTTGRNRRQETVVTLVDRPTENEAQFVSVTCSFLGGPRNRADIIAVEDVTRPRAPSFLYPVHDSYPPMGSKASEPKHHTGAKIEEVVVPTIPQDTVDPTTPQDIQDTIPRIPQDIIDEILDYLAADSDSQSLQSCVLVSKSWAQSRQRSLFHTVVITPRNVDRWLTRFPVPEESPARHVRDLRVVIGGSDGSILDRFFEYTPCFTDLDKMSLLGRGRVKLSQGPSLWRLPKSITSLTIDVDFDVLTLMHVRDAMAQLPNLDDLALSMPSRSFSPMGRRPGIGTVLKGRFSGKLRIRDGFVDEGVVGMLLEVPSG